ncbi:hypothetical protein BDB00DRAFT_407542 [Zychaea mexicana]|uniref:uncharacterized protein n=1 Tax=Zychaea mexicana TaxID=64656 RepID=UPI0022FDE299|nr:uncharacterized protein BDB00DRAFT_407542 [Zychaea mexicana]KAI9493067.1 hypothetical protein BDB00DRAFT_407542 [Zychaea mexicana]
MSMLWLLCLVCERLPQWSIPRIHEYLLWSFATAGNPHIDASKSIADEDERSRITALGSNLLSHLLHSHNDMTKKSVYDLLDQYFAMVKRYNEGIQESDIQIYLLGYMLALPRIAPVVVSECWKDVFKKLYETRGLGDMFLHERETNQSLVRTTSGEVISVANAFSSWLYTVAFDKNGLIMKHALDIAIALDAMAYDSRLGLHYLIPSGGRSIIDTLKPSFDKLDLEPASVDLIEWILPIIGTSKASSERGPDDLKIPLFLLQMSALKSSTSSTAIDMFVALITRLDREISNDTTPQADAGARYLILNLVAAAEEKWPGIFETILEQVFSKAIAMHIANSGGSINVEKILTNLSMLFEEASDSNYYSRPGFNAFKNYMKQRWRQVLLLFVNHPSMECRALGYRALRHSHFWENSGDSDMAAKSVDPMSISKLLMDAWFRHMKSRYTFFKENHEESVLDELEYLITRCCQNLALAKAIFSAALDGITGGALELFPSVDIEALRQEKIDLLSKIRHNGSASSDNSPSSAGSLKSIQQRRPPQFLSLYPQLDQMIELQDRVYINNIERSANLFYKFQEQGQKYSQEHKSTVNFHILSHLSVKWPSATVLVEAYDEALPMNIPCARDITIGNAFKDHPVLFLIVEKCSANSRFPVDDMLRSILVYFIAFWHMGQVAQAPTTLKFATQLEETAHLNILMKHMLPQSFHDVYKLFPFMSARDMGAILHHTIWPFIRVQRTVSDIPGLGTASSGGVSFQNDVELETKCINHLSSIYQDRMKVLEAAPTWHEACKKIGCELNL